MTTCFVGLIGYKIGHNIVRNYGNVEAQVAPYYTGVQSYNP